MYTGVYHYQTRKRPLRARLGPREEIAGLIGTLRKETSPPDALKKLRFFKAKIFNRKMVIMCFFLEGLRGPD